MGQKGDYKVALVNTTNADTQVTVAMNATTSSIINCGGTAPVGIYLPAAFVACNITFNCCQTPTGTFVPMVNFDGSAFVVAGNPSVYLPLLPAMFNGILYLQLGFSAAQTTAETLVFQLAPIYQGIHA